MNTNKTVTSAVLLLMIIIFFSCGGKDISGVFIPKVKTRVKSIEFREGNARFTDSFLEIKQGCMEFDVRGDKIIIKDPFTGPMVFKIIDTDTIKCEIPGLSGLYIRQK